uniref:Uncharacterized protein n=1 Tax=Triticum urartu TaxID=4572 RepID=A0A8R7PTQ7_TRIUA
RTARSVRRHGWPRSQHGRGLDLGYLHRGLDLGYLHRGLDLGYLHRGLELGYLHRGLDLGYLHRGLELGYLHRGLEHRSVLTKQLRPGWIWHCSPHRIEACPTSSSPRSPLSKPKGLVVLGASGQLASKIGGGSVISAVNDEGSEAATAPPAPCSSVGRPVQLGCHGRPPKPPPQPQ